MQVTELREQFAVGEKTNRDKLLTALGKEFGAQVPLEKLVRSVYGKSNGNNKPFFFVLNSLNNIIADKKLKFEIKKTRDESGTAYGLYQKASRTRAKKK